MKSLCTKLNITRFPKQFSAINGNFKFLTNYPQIKTNVHQKRKGESIQRSVWEHLLPSVIIQNKITTAEDWKNVRDQILQSDQEITTVSVDSVILNFCIKIKNYSLAYSYLQFLKETNIKFNIATLGKYFKVFYLVNSGKIITEMEEQDIFNRYKEIRETYEVLDSTTCENVILALSITRYWQEGLKLLDEIKISCIPSSLPYSVMAASAFKNKNYNLGWKLLEEMIDKNRVPLDLVYSSYIETCRAADTKDTFLQKLETLFQFFRVNNVECNSEVALKLMESCKEFNIHVTKTTVTSRGLCLSCKHKLQNLTLTEQDFEKLKQAIFENVIVGKNVFHKTTPAEVEKFKAFLSNMKKYDVVIDGLNVAYCTGTKQSTHIFSKFVISVVQHFVEQNQKVLVLGRTHMTNWPNWKQVIHNADTFLAQSLSQDDPYLLYCALNCGLNTTIVSKDLMRSHLFKLKDPHLKIMFSQWLYQSQLHVRHINNQGKVFLNYPQPFLRTTQNNNTFWHVPYNEDDEKKWLCISS